MKLEVILINDTGAVEFTDNYFDNSYTHKTFLADLKVKSKFPDIKFNIDLKMYDDNEFNSLNDIIHAPINFIVNDKVKSILQKHNLPAHVFLPAKISRKEKSLIIKKTKTYEYNWFCFDCEHIENYYNYIDFEKSKITFFKGKDIINMNVRNIADIYTIIQENYLLSDKINAIYKDKSLNDKQKSEKSLEFQTVSWVADSITLNNKFPKDIDIFNLPLFSWMTFVSDKMKTSLINENISDIKFIETGTKSRLEGVRNPKIIIE